MALTISTTRRSVPPLALSGPYPYVDLRHVDLRPDGRGGGGALLHSRRVLMAFRKRGFPNVRVVSDHTPRAPLPTTARRRSSARAAFTSDSKRYDDPLSVLKMRSPILLTALREWAAIAAYKWQRGDI